MQLTAFSKTREEEFDGEQVCRRAHSLGCCRFQGHLVKVESETGGGVWERDGSSAGSSSLRP
jgi:hypothetical protein